MSAPRLSGRTVIPRPYEFDEATGGITKEIKYYAGDYDFDVCFAVAKKSIKRVKE